MFGNTTCVYVCVFRDSYLARDQILDFCRYMNAAELEVFLSNRVKETGMLQQFVEPQGEQNRTHRVVWTPHVVSFETSTNNVELSSKQVRRMLGNPRNLYFRLGIALS